MKTDREISQETWNRIENLLRFDILGVFSFLVLIWFGFWYLLRVIEERSQN